MSLGRLVVAAVKVEGRPKAEVARGYGVSRQWVYEIIRRFGSSNINPWPARPQVAARARTSSSISRVARANSASATPGAKRLTTARGRVWPTRIS